MAKEKKQKQETEQKIAAMESKVVERRQKLGEYNALFMALDGGARMAKAPGQRLGATQAVLGTRRIIERELGKLQNEIATKSMTLNKARDKNLQLREKVDNLRKEHVTFRKLFGHMSGELEEIKTKIKSACGEGR